MTTIQQQVLSELEHIPANRRETQNLLRMAYNVARLQSLGKNATKQQSPFDVIQECLTFLNGKYPGYEFEYDKEFFRKPNLADILTKYKNGGLNASGS